jgi:hypothetical protein
MALVPLSQRKPGTAVAVPLAQRFRKRRRRNVRLGSVSDFGVGPQSRPSNRPGHFAGERMFPRPQMVVCGSCKLPSAEARSSRRASVLRNTHHQGARAGDRRSGPIHHHQSVALGWPSGQYGLGENGPISGRCIRRRYVLGIQRRGVIVDISTRSVAMAKPISAIRNCVRNFHDVCFGVHSIAGPSTKTMAAKPTSLW